METCTVETGLLKKKPCGHPSVTHCANCEQPLCKQHAVAQPREPGKGSKFMCKECDAARRAFEKNVPPPVAVGPKKPAEEAPKAAAPGAAATAAKEAPKAAPGEAEKAGDDGGGAGVAPQHEAHAA